MAHRVFLSHATEDRERATEVCTLLEAEGIDCWIAPRDVKGGLDYAAAILEAIRSSDLVFLLFSAHANSSPYVVREIERAVAYGRPVLSLRLDDAVPDPSMEYHLNEWLEVPDAIADHQQQIVDAVQARLAQSPGVAVGSDRGKTGVASSAPAARQVRDRWWARWTGRRLWWLTVASAMVLAVLGLGLGLGLGRTAHATALVPDHGRWTQLAPVGTLPPERCYQRMVQDPSTGRFILFGGQDRQYAALGDTWSYDPVGDAWTNLQPSGDLPPARWGHSLVYDPITHTVLLFGGRNETVRFNDTWSYSPSANTWTRLVPTGTIPPERSGFGAVYDPSAGRFFVFGGASGDVARNDLWAFDSTAMAWTELSPSGVPPSPRLMPQLAYDPATHRVILFGGCDENTDFNDIWAYSAASNTWTQLHPSGSLLPARGNGCAMAYDSALGVMILFGGDSDYTQVWYNDVWAYDCRLESWIELRPTGSLPLPRAGLSMAYDPSTNRLVVFGGASEIGVVNDTWAFTP